MTVTRAGIVSLAFLAAALVFGVVLGFVLAFGSSDTDSWEERWAELRVEEAEFEFLGDFTRGERAAIRLELKAAQVVFAEHFGAVTSDLRVYLATERDLLNEVYSSDQGEQTQVWFTCGGLAFADVIFMVLEACSDEGRRYGGPLAHEYFHVLQYGAGSVPVTGNIWPDWVVEGSAEYAQALVSEARGRIPFEVLRENARLTWASLARPLPRDSYSLSDPVHATVFTYQVGFLAIDWLVERTGPGAILEFFRLGSHEDAFQQAFGMTLETFEAAFEEHRIEVAPPFTWQIGGTIVDPDGKAVDEIMSLAYVRIAGEWSSAGWSETDSQGAFLFTGPGAGYTIALWLQCPSRINVVGDWVYLGEWGSTGFVPDNDGFLEKDEAGAVPFADGDRDRTSIVIELPWTRAEVVAEHCES